jgi:hypothetical protein
MMIDAAGLAKWFLKEVVRCNGLPATIVSDEGPQISLTFDGQICTCLRIDRPMSTACHPQIDGQIEQHIVSMEQYLWVFINHEEDYCVKWLPFAEDVANNGSSESPKCAPFLPFHVWIYGYHMQDNR